jgi:hypothetical protein
MPSTSWSSTGLSLLVLVTFLWLTAQGVAQQEKPTTRATAAPAAATPTEPKVTAIPKAVIERYKLDTDFYKKHLDYKGFSILGSAKVSETALYEARYLIDRLLGQREDILKALIDSGCRFMVMAPTEMTTDVPEQRRLKNDTKTNWDRRARGLGGKLSSCGEENLLNLPGDRYRQENILIHEFNHAIHQQGLRHVDPTFQGRLKKAYDNAVAKELWKGSYVVTNPAEYWAEGAQAYFDCMRPQFGANTREKLEKYDPDLFALVDEVYKQSKYRYVRYDRRESSGAKQEQRDKPQQNQNESPKPGAAAKPHQLDSTGVSVRPAVAQDESQPLAQSLKHSTEAVRSQVSGEFQAFAAPEDTVARAFIAAVVEQKTGGGGPAPELVASFDGLGDGFKGPQGTATFRNPSDNSLAVGPDHIVQLVNSRMAVFTKKGNRFDTTGKVLYGPVSTGNVFKDFGGFGDLNNGDAVVRYDQLADRWLVVMPVFRRLPFKKNAPAGKSGGPVQLSLPGVEGQPGEAKLLHQPQPGERAATGRPSNSRDGSYAIFYAVSTTSDPLGSYYRYLFERPLFPDYPRPAVWPDGYYVTTSTSDDLIQRHAYVVDRAKMLEGKPATEQGFVIDGVDFLINADLDGKQLPPAGAPNIMMALGGAQLKKVLTDDGIYWWKFHVDWEDASKSKLEGPTKLIVAAYEYLGGGQLTQAVPQPGTTRKLDVQGDKLMSRVVYRRIGDREMIVGAHSVKTAAGGGGVRWYELTLDGERNVKLNQQGTYAPDGSWRWMPSPAIDGRGNIGIGYSFGGTPHFPGQRFAGRRAGDPLGLLSLKEVVLVVGEASQASTLRWQDYTQTAVDPSDDLTIWYVGDYLKKGATNYSSRIGAFRLGGAN